MGADVHVVRERGGLLSRGGPLAYDVLKRRRALAGQDPDGRTTDGFEAGDQALGIELGTACTASKLIAWCLTWGSYRQLTRPGSTR